MRSFIQTIVPKVRVRFHLHKQVTEPKDNLYQYNPIYRANHCAKYSNSRLLWANVKRRKTSLILRRVDLYKKCQTKKTLTTLPSSCRSQTAEVVWLVPPKESLFFSSLQKRMMRRWIGKTILESSLKRVLPTHGMKRWKQKLEVRAEHR